MESRVLNQDGDSVVGGKRSPTSVTDIDVTGPDLTVKHSSELYWKEYYVLLLRRYLLIALESCWLEIVLVA